MNRKKSGTLDHCIKLLESGASLQSIFIEYPDLTPEMRGVLETASEVMSLRVGDVPAETIQRSRTAFLDRAKELSVIDTRSHAGSNFFKPIHLIQKMFRNVSSLSPFACRLIIIFSIAIIFVLFSGGLIITSAKSLPGDTLYPVKRAVEDLSVNLMPDKNVRAQYEDDYSQERVTEINRLLALKRAQQVSFIGVVQSMSEGEWLVSGISVMTSSDTRIGNMSESQMNWIGMVVEVEGTTTSQGWVNADEIHLHEFQMDGLVEAISSHFWQISGNRLYVNADSNIDAGIQVGDEVMITVHSEDSDLYILAIHRMGKDAQTPVKYPSETNDFSNPTEDEEIFETDETNHPTEEYKSTDTPEPGDQPEHDVTPWATPTPGDDEGNDHSTPKVSLTPSLPVTPEPTDDD